MSFQIQVTAAGTAELPADLLEGAGMHAGDRLVIELDERNRLVIKSYADVVRDGQKAFRATIRQPFTVDDFLAERSAQAADE